MEQRRCLCRAYRRAIDQGRSFAASLAGLPERAYALAYLGFLTGQDEGEPARCRFPGLSAEAAAMVRGVLRGVMDRADEEFLRRRPG